MEKGFKRKCVENRLKYKHSNPAECGDAFTVCDNPKHTSCTMHRLIAHLDQKDAKEESKRGVRIRVDSINAIEPCDEPGLHIVTNNPIQRIYSVNHHSVLSGSDMTVTLDIGTVECPIKIHKRGRKRK